MYLKVVVTVCLALIVLESVTGAPHNARTGEDLEKSFIEFLHQDKELAPLLEKANLKTPTALSRNIRQAEIEGNEGFSDEDGNEPPQKKDGFFDRAAKFVMEVLQRFLKWVNADN